jgi:hypothetical protein
MHPAHNSETQVGLSTSPLPALRAQLPRGRTAPRISSERERKVTSTMQTQKRWLRQGLAWASLVGSSLVVALLLNAALASGGAGQSQAAPTPAVSRSRQRSPMVTTCARGSSRAREASNSTSRRILHCLTDRWSILRWCRGGLRTEQKGTGAIFAPNGTRSDIALIGRTVYDGQGGLSGTQTDSIGGTFERDTLVGTYAVRPDCTGSETFTFSPSGEVVHADFVVVAQSHAILFIDTDPGVMLTVTATRQ